MSEFMYLFRATAAESREALGTPEMAQRSLQAWRAWIQELETKGHLKHRGAPLDKSGKVVRGEKKEVSDGPYAETKDIVLGFIIVEAQDIDQAVALSRGCPMLRGQGSVEVRPVAALAV